MQLLKLNCFNTKQPTGEHFNLPRHELYHLKVSDLEKVWDLGRSKRILTTHQRFYGRTQRNEQKKIVFI